MPNKYRAQRTRVGNVVYASRREAEYAEELHLRQRAGEVLTIEIQVPYELIPRPNLVKYVADFRVTFKDGRQEVHEVKGMETAVWKIKEKLFRHRYPHIPLRVIR